VNRGGCMGAGQGGHPQSEVRGLLPLAPKQNFCLCYLHRPTFEHVIDNFFPADFLPPLETPAFPTTWKVEVPEPL